MLRILSKIMNLKSPIISNVHHFGRGKDAGKDFYSDGSEVVRSDVHVLGTARNKRIHLERNKLNHEATR